MSADPRPMTRSEAQAFNAGVEAMRAIARAAADTIEKTGRRPLPEAFATAALRQLDHDAQHLLRPTEPTQRSAGSDPE